MDAITTKDRVYRILEENPTARDDYWSLLIEFYRRYYGTTDMRRLKSMEGVPAVDSVRRARQWLQERTPHLRGETYKLRQVYAGQVRQLFGQGGFGLDH